MRLGSLLTVVHACLYCGLLCLVMLPDCDPVSLALSLAITSPNIRSSSCCAPSTTNIIVAHGLGIASYPVTLERRRESLGTRLGLVA